MTWTFVTVFSIDTLVALFAAFISLIIAYTALKTSRRSVDQTGAVLNAQRTANRPFFGDGNVSVKVFEVIDKHLKTCYTATISLRNVGGVSAMIEEIIIRSAMDDEGKTYYARVDKVAGAGAEIVFKAKGLYVEKNIEPISLSLRYSNYESEEKERYSQSKFDEEYILKTSSGTRYDVTISYSYDNKELYNEIVKGLKEEDVKIMDMYDFPDGSFWDREMQSRIEQSECFLVLATETYPFESASGMMEYSIARTSERKIIMINTDGHQGTVLEKHIFTPKTNNPKEIVQLALKSLNMRSKTKND